jgi:hypothetical protein
MATADYVIVVTKSGDFGAAMRAHVHGDTRKLPAHAFALSCVQPGAYLELESDRNGLCLKHTVEPRA